MNRAVHNLGGIYNMIKKKEKRTFPRAYTNLPVKIGKNLSGYAVDLSETGISLVVDKSLLAPDIKLEIELPHKEIIKPNVKVIWKKYIFGESRFQCGANFVNFYKKSDKLLRTFICSNLGINPDFINIASSFEAFLKSVKAKFDEFDKRHRTHKQRIAFIESQKHNVIPSINNYLFKIWQLMEKLDKTKFDYYTSYLRAIVNYLFIYACEINNHIFKKPLGYPGDFIIMNYIFDYHDKDYLGKSSYEMFLNQYACNVPIAESNIKRKEFFKNKIRESIYKLNNAKILSIGSGSARELIELLNEGNIHKNFIFHCLDFEEKAINYLKNEINNIDIKRRKVCRIKYINKNFLDFFRNSGLDDLLKGYDFIYCSGVFDYLNDLIAMRLIEKFLQLLNPNGILILCNANTKDSHFRVTYEIMGDWVFYHREKKDLINWINKIGDIKETTFDGLSDTSNYHFLIIKK